MAWIIVFLQKKHGQVKNISKKEFCVIGLSGVPQEHLGFVIIKLCMMG